MNQVTVKSYSKEVEKKLIDQIWKNMEKVGLVVENQAKRNVTQNPPAHPQVQTGQLRSSIMHWVYSEGGNIAVSIGSTINNPPYPRWLEFGNSRQPPYPWLFPAIETNRDKITSILGNKWGVEQRTE
jgi:HK97 gp10 family phage protein